MDRKSKPTYSQVRRRRQVLIASLVAVAVVIALIVMEQVAVLYVAATLSVTALLAVVAWSELGGARRPSTELAPHDDAAAIADGVTSPSTTFGINAPRGRTSQRR